jgi:hypothetical protein
MKALGIIEIKGGNVRHNHLYLDSVIDLFPIDGIGGSSADSLGVAVEIHCGISAPVITDIAGDKNIFRRRSWVKEFFESHAIKEGDRVVIHRTAPRRFHIYPASSGA